LLPIGGIARIERMPERPGQEIAVALAGPAVNVAIWGAVMLALAPDDPAGRLGAIEDPTGGFWARLAGVNLFLALFNLIPAFPMDGGRVLRALLQVPLGRVRATRLAARAGQVFAFAFGLAGLLGGSPVLVLIAVFVFIAAGAESQDVELRDMARTARAADAMVSRFEALAERDALGAAAQAVIRTTQHEFPVLDPAGRIAGFLTRGAIIEALAGRTHPADVGAAMARAIPEMPPDAPLIAVIEALGRSRAPAVAIVAGGRLAGYVTAENLGEMLLLRGAGGPLPRPDQRQAREHP
jgi:CBS domain-containing protein